MTISEQRLKQIITESINQVLIAEAFKSDKLRDFFTQHGGVNRRYRQFSLGDIDDSQIGYTEVFDNANDASDRLFQLKRPDPRTGQRSAFDMKYLFKIYTANDGTSILVGIDRDTIQTGHHWAGENEKKVNDRLWRNDWNFKTRDNRYVDDSDTYYYKSPARDFGLTTSNDFQGRKKGIEQQKELMNDEPRYSQWRQDRLKHMREYLRNNYPDSWKKLKK